MFKKAFLPCFLWLLPFILFSQDFDHYKKLKSEGKIPEKFTVSSTEKYLADVKKQKEEKVKKRERRIKQNFYLENNFLVDELLLSGKLLYNDPISLYVNKVMDELLKDDKALRNQIEVYIIKSPSVNAFALNQGIIVVNMGLLAKLHNEAELAYVLAHETIHFREKHVIKGYVEEENIKNNKGAYRKTTIEDKLLARSIYSQDQEKEADLEGLKLFLKTDYDVNSIQGVFDVLDFAHTPFADIAFKKSFFEDKNVVLPQSYFMAETAPLVTGDELSKMIYEANKKKKATAVKPKNKKEQKEQEKENKEKEQQEEEELHKYSTHPSVANRRKAIAEKLKNNTPKKGKTFIVNEKEFLNVRKIARFENSRLYLQGREYEAALYNTYLLLQENPRSIYLQKCLVKSLYGMAKYASTKRFSEIHTDPEYIVGESQQVNYLVEKISASELTVLALSEAWKLRQRIPGDAEVNELVKDLFAEMVDNYYSQKSFFSTTPRPESTTNNTYTDTSANALADTEEASEPAPKRKLKRRKKVKANKKKTKFNKASDMTKYAFADLLQDPEFSKMYDEEIKASKKRKADIRKTKTYSYKRAQEKTETRNITKGDALGLEKVVFINPFYIKINLTKRKSLRFIESEAAQKKLNAKIQLNATRAGLEYSMVDKKTLTALGTEGYNENTVLNDFMDEMYEHGDIHFVNYMDEDMQALIQKYGTSNFVWTGFITVKKKKEGVLGKIAAAVVYPFIIPLVVVDMATPDYDTYFYSVVVDVKTGKKLKTSFFNLNIRDRNDVLDGTLYDLYSQYKNIPAQAK